MSGGRRIKKPAPKAKARAAAKTARRPKAKAAVRPAEPAMDLAVGRRIRGLRHEHKLSLETIADRTDLSIGFLSQIERGLSSPSLRVLATLADVLGVGIAALFGSRPSDDPASGGVVTRRLRRVARYQEASAFCPHFSRILAMVPFVLSLASEALILANNSVSLLRIPIATVPTVTGL